MTAAAANHECHCSRKAPADGAPFVTRAQPSDIPAGRRCAIWAGGWAARHDVGSTPGCLRFVFARRPSVPVSRLPSAAAPLSTSQRLRGGPHSRQPPPSGGRREPGAPQTGLGIPRGRRHRAGPRRHRAGSRPPTLQSLSGRAEHVALLVRRLLADVLVPRQRLRQEGAVAGDAWQQLASQGRRRQLCGQTAERHTRLWWGGGARAGTRLSLMNTPVCGGVPVCGSDTLRV